MLELTIFFVNFLIILLVQLDVFTLRTLDRPLSNEYINFKIMPNSDTISQVYPAPAINLIHVKTKNISSQVS